MRNIRWGILGCGQIANSFAEALKHVNHAELYASASRDYNKAENFSKKWGFKKAFGDYIDLVNDKNIDIIYIATPHSYHFAHTKLSLEAGKHVLCEKPFTINKLQLEELIKIARDKKLFLMEALWTLAFPGTRKVKELIDMGKIGEIISLDADFGYRFPDDPNHRIYNPLLAGGSLLDIGIYPLFLSLFLFGKPNKIIAHSKLNENNIDIATSVIIENKNGVVCNLNSNIKANTNIKASIYGTKGKIEFGEWWFTPSDITITLDNQESTILQFPPLANGYEYEAIEATNCILNGQKESKLIPLNFSLSLIECMDEIRRIGGISYPPEIESIDKPYGWIEIKSALS